MKLYYIACPYFDPDPAIMEHRFEHSTYVASTLVAAGFAVYSHLTMVHPINQLISQVKKKITWSPINDVIMEKCDELIILTLPGWKECMETKLAITYFKQRNKTIWTYDRFATNYNL